MKPQTDKGEPARLTRHRLSNALLFVGVGAVCVVGLMALIGDAQTFDEASGFVKQISLWLMVARLAAVFLVWWYWNAIVDWMFQSGNQAGVAPLKAKRHTLAMFIVVFELVLVQNVFGHLLTAMS